MLLFANYLVITGSVEGTGPYFAFLIATLMVLSLGPYMAILFIVLYLGSQTYFLLSDFSFVYAYPPSHMLRIIVGQTALLFMICASEWVRRRSYYQMQLSSETHFKIAVTDALTGITNRVGVEQYIEQWQKDGTSGALILVDLDHFKQVNDEFGHDAGDRALVKFAHTLRENIKGRDTVARWGCEEFIVLLPETTLENAAQVMNDLRLRFAHTSIKTPKREFKVTFSAGISELKQAGDFEAALKHADDLLYKAKAAGRNRVLYESSDTKENAKSED
jgi:diguanylate cyclase (GGDEF)-like protein